MKRKQKFCIARGSRAQFAWFYTKFDQYIYCNALERVRAYTHRRRREYTLGGLFKGMQIRTNKTLRAAIVNNPTREEKQKWNSEAFALSHAKHRIVQSTWNALALFQSHFAHDLLKLDIYRLLYNLRVCVHFIHILNL